jgi:hypothetical protein
MTVIAKAVHTFDSFPHSASRSLDRPKYRADLGRVYSSRIGFLMPTDHRPLRR